jgi:superfamily II DNA helicase RecQ
MLPSEDQLASALSDVGLQAFRPLQQEAICAVCDKKDCLVVMATGMALDLHALLSIIL